MNADSALEIIEKIVLSRQLSPIEQLIIRQSWIGKSYDDMAQNINYSSNYLKVIGFDLWNNISNVVGQKITKKNIQLILTQYLQNRNLAVVDSTRDNLVLPTEDVVASRQIEFPNSPLLENSALYINRPPIEELVRAEIAKPGCVVRIKAPKKMGKNSLINQIVKSARTYNYQIAYLDFQEADQAIFSNLDKFLRWFCTFISRQLNLNPRLDDYWDEDIGSKVSCKVYFQEYLLNQIDIALVLVLNEVNCVFEHPHIASEFLPMLRFWHEIARVDEVWQKLRLVIAHSTEVYIPLKLHQSPFNVGLAIKLPQFTNEQVKLLAACYQIDWMNDQQIQELMSMVGGHPYLINLAFYHLCVERIPLQKLLLEAPTLAGIYSDHLRGHLAILQQEPELAIFLQQVLKSNDGVFLDALAAYKLESMGLVELDGNLASITCELYRLYFQSQLEQENSLFDPFRQSYINNFAPYSYFRQYLETEWRQWMQQSLPLSLIWCDIDYFKSYNKYHGLSAGNTALQQITSTVCDCVKYQAAFIARHNVEEFVVVLPKIDTDNAVEIAENIRTRVQALGITVRTQAESEEFSTGVLTMSLGVATIQPNSQLYPDTVIAAAQQAMIQSKRQGRNRVSV
ncbi:MAG: AAA-like domain-containing protein [Calothrix sp. C42_A2020_038]|nr:AAA-like domain-containing protein [Calothrix sp. C42_A2020_038]